MAKIQHHNKTITTAHIELDTLQEGSVILDSLGHAWQMSRGYWYRAYDQSETGSASSLELAHLAPITVIHHGTH